MRKMLVKSPSGARQMQSPERLCYSVLASSARGARPTLAGPGVNGCEPRSLPVRTGVTPGAVGPGWHEAVTGGGGTPGKTGARTPSLETARVEHGATPNPPKRRNQV
jgi:hypothetical protein